MPLVLHAVAAELLEQGLEQPAHAAVELAARSTVGSQQQQGAGIHQGCRLIAGELKQMLFAAVGNAQG